MIEEKISAKEVQTFECKIYAGLGIGYSGQSHPIEKAKEIIQKYVDEIGWCVTVTETEYIYKNGREPGFVVGIINYPRFPLPQLEIEQRAYDLAKELLIGLDQYRVTLSTAFWTVLLTNESKEERDGKKQ